MNSVGVQKANTPRTCVCYVINNGYILPALVSAAQARTFVSSDSADVFIIIVDKRTETSPVVEAAAHKHGVEIRYVDPSDIDSMHIMFGRLFVHKLLPESYERIIYIDGDTQIAGSLEPLCSVSIPEGYFLACRDPTALFAQLSKYWFRRITGQRKEIGFDRPYGDYFNSGVLVLERNTWGELSEACLTMARLKGQTLRYPDQDILNLAIGDHCKLISNRWNYPGFLIGSKVERKVHPVIYHFMSNPRPWDTPVPPWGEAWTQPYLDLLKEHPELGFLEPRKSARRTMRYWLQQGYKIVMEYHAAGMLVEPDPDISI